jgi:precorrin-6Y C5,15-methyltransferase (decarboxylating)
VLTIAGSGINKYSLKEISKKIQWEDFDCLICDSNFENSGNLAFIPENIEKFFLPYRQIKETIRQKIEKNSNILYVVTGSPLFFSATQEILNFLEKEFSSFNRKEVKVINAESSLDYVLSKLKIPSSETISISLHGRNTIDLNKFLSLKYTFILCDEFSINLIAENISFIKDNLKIFLGARLGWNDEFIKEINLQEIVENMPPEEVKHKLCPYILLIERNYDLLDPISKNEDFETNAGMLTKTDKRFISLQALELKPNLLMWDIGAGSGSISIDAYKTFKIRAVLFEKNEKQVEFIKRNLNHHKIPSAKVFEGDAAENLQGFENPDRIFIGGGGERILEKISDLYSVLNPEGIIVVNLVGLENLAVLIQALKIAKIEYEARTIDISSYKKILGIDLTISEPERTLFQIKIKKG